MESVPAANKAKLNPILIGILSIVGLCVLCAVCGGIASAMQSAGLLPTTTPSSAELKMTEIGAQVDEFSSTMDAGSTEVVETESAPELPTSTPEPTDVPLPTATEDPGRVTEGTYLVGTDIQPGIYKGQAGVGLFDSCYWARLKDFSGEFDAILANGNADGQFYVEIKSSDYAIEVRCDMTLLVSPTPVSEFPKNISEGMYLVGIDIQPGTYRGEAGTDITESCYWSRLRNVTGDFDGIIANDNATGQFYVQVAPGDFALSTGCDLERTGD